jgi:hypothetical protein
MTAWQERRLRERRARLLIRAWDYRQRDLARGVWFRLRRVLADAREAYVITRAEGERLSAEGGLVEPVGRELQPPRLILFTPAGRVSRIEGARAIPVRLSAELLEAECLALVRFRSTGPDGGDAKSDVSEGAA